MAFNQPGHNVLPLGMARWCRRKFSRCLARRLQSFMFAIALNLLCFMLLLCVYMYSRGDPEEQKPGPHPPDFLGERSLVLPEMPSKSHRTSRTPGKASNGIGVSCNNLTHPTHVKDRSWWFPVEDTARDTFVFSAYVDAREQKAVVKIIGISNDLGFDTRGWQGQKTLTKYCQLWYAGNTIPTIVRAQYDIVPETHDLEYAPSFHTCALPESRVFPYAVSLVRRPCAPPTHVLQVKHHQEEPPENDFTVCISPLNFHYDDVASFVENIELQRSLGATKFVVYNHSCGARLQRYLERYAKEGVIDVIPWQLPVRVHVRPPDPMVTPQIHYFGQVVALNECLYRYMYKSKYIVFTDLDEVVIPRQNRTWSEMMDSVNDRFTDSWSGRDMTSGAFMFQNVFFRIDWPDTPLPDKPLASTFNLRTLLKTVREDKIWAPYMRSKYIANPRTVEVVGIHFVFNFIARKYGHKEVPSDTALLHHYRDWGNEDAVDRIPDPYVVAKYGNELIKRVSAVHRSLNLGIFQV